MRDRPVRHRLEYLLYLLTRRLLLLLDHTTVAGLGRVVGRLYFRLARGRRELALANMERTLTGLDADQRLEITRRCFEHYGSTFFEVVSAERFDAREIVKLFEIRGWEHIEEAEAHGRGYLLIAGHYGTWELALLALSLRLNPIHVVARPPDNPWVSRDAERLRLARGNILLSRRGAAHGMLRVLRRRGRIALVIDQRVAPWKGVLVPFLGRPAWTTPVPAFLSIHTGAPVLPISCVPRDEGGYLLQIERMILPEGRDECAEALLTRRYLESLEQQIRRRPEMWLWMHRRWQLTQPRLNARHTQRLRRGAGLPRASTFDAVAELGLPAAEAQRLRRWSSGEFLERAADTLLIGGTDEQRAHAVSMLGDGLIENGKAVRFVLTDVLLDELLRARQQGKYGRALRELDAHDLLILGEIDHTPLNPEQLAMLERLLDQRRERRSILIGAADGPRQWPENLCGSPQIRGLLAGADVLDLSGTDGSGELEPIRSNKDRNAVGSAVH